MTITAPSSPAARPAPQGVAPEPLADVMVELALDRHDIICDVPVDGSQAAEGPAQAEPHPEIATPGAATAGPELPARQAVPLESVARGMTLAALPDRTLTPGELLELAASIALDPASWQDQVAFNDEKRHFASLHRDAHVDVWLLCWTPVNDTGWHDHDISSAGVAVARGQVVEQNLAIGGPAPTTELAAGLGFCFGPEHIHRMTGQAPGSVSIHVYSPPLWRMGQYAVSPTGVLRRTSVSYADELRPLA